MRKAALHNLGCKVNAYETEAMQQMLEDAGYDIVPFTEKHTQNVFGVVCHHTEEGGDPHPEHRTGTTGDDGRCHAGDVAGADGGSERCAQGLELGDGMLVVIFCALAVVLEDAGDGVLPPVGHMAHLEELGAAGQQHTGADQQDQSRQTPHRVIDHAVDRRDHFYDLFHLIFLLEY